MSSTNNLAERDKILDKIQKEIINKKNLLIEMHNDNYRKNTIEDTEYNDYINSQLTIYEKQLEKLRNLLEHNDLLALEKKDDPSLLKEIKMDQKDIYAEIRKIEKELNKIN
jgi:hypothetical protein